MPYSTFVFPEFVKSIDTIAWCVFGGVIVAAVMALYFNKVLGSFIRFIIKNGYDSPENAVVLEQTKFKSNYAVFNAIRKGTYKRVLKYDEPENTDGLTEKQLILKRKYYIPHDLVYEAENIFDKKGTSWGALILTVVFFFAIALLILTYAPDLAAMLGALYS